jgi:hypothetical protein
MIAIRPAFVTAYFTIWTVYAVEVPQDRPNQCASYIDQACAASMPWEHGHLGLHVENGTSTTAIAGPRPIDYSVQTPFPNQITV